MIMQILSRHTSYSRYASVISLEPTENIKGSEGRTASISSFQGIRQ